MTDDELLDWWRQKIHRLEVVLALRGDRRGYMSYSLDHIDDPRESPSGLAKQLRRQHKHFLERLNRLERYIGLELSR